jgi:hypothetical protein
MGYTGSPEASALYSDDCYPWNSNRVSETLGITGEMKTMSQATNFFNQILSFLAYGASPIVATLELYIFHLQRLVRFEIDVSASAGGFSVDFGGQCHFFPDDQNVQKRNRIA